MEKATSEVKVPLGSALSAFGGSVTVMQHELRLKQDRVARHFLKDPKGKKVNHGPIGLTKEPVAQSKKDLNKKGKVVPKELCDLMGYRGVILRAEEARKESPSSATGPQKSGKASADVAHLLK